MAGIFDPQQLPESSMRGESFIAQPTVADHSASLNSALNIGARVRGKHAVESAQEKIEEEQNSFLGGLGAQREDLAELDELRQASPQESAAFDAAADRIKTLQSAINSRQINPSRAISRIEALKREALVKAPMFANHIKGLSGDRGAEFNHETDMALKRAEIRNQDMAKMGLNADNPGHVRTYNEILATKTQAEFLQNQETITSRDAGTVLGASVKNAIRLESTKLNSIIESSGGVDRLDASDRQQAVIALQRFTNGNEQNIVEGIIRQSFTPAQAAMINDETRNRYAAMIKAQADYKIKQLNGSLPKEISENEISFLDNEVMTGLAKKNPALYQYVVIQSKIPGQSLGGRTTQQAAGRDFSTYFENLALGKFGDIEKDNIIEGENGATPKQIQDGAAANLGDFRRWVRGADGADPEVAGAHFRAVTNQAQALATRPSQYSPKIFDELIATVNDDNFMDVFSKMDSDTQREFTENMRTATQTYAREVMAVDMFKELNKDYWADFKASGARSGGLAQVREFVTPTVSDSGALKFIPNTNFSTDLDNVRASNLADKLNKMYSNRSIAMVNAAQKLAGLGDDLRKEFTTRIFQDAMMTNAQKPLKKTADAAKEPKLPLLQVAKGVMSIMRENGISEDEARDKILSGEFGTEQLRASLESLGDKY